MSILFALMVVGLFWAGYYCGWQDHKEQVRTFALIDRLWELAKKGMAK